MVKYRIIKKYIKSTAYKVPYFVAQKRFLDFFYRNLCINYDTKTDVVATDEFYTFNECRNALTEYINDEISGKRNRKQIIMEEFNKSGETLNH